MRLINQNIGIDFFLLEIALTVEHIWGDPDNPDSAGRETTMIPIAAVRNKAGAAFATAQYLLESHPEIDFKMAWLNNSDQIYFPIPPGQTTRSIVKIVEDGLRDYFVFGPEHHVGRSGRVMFPLLDHMEQDDDPEEQCFFSVGIRITRLPMY
jgi:hypothetical protein